MRTLALRANGDLRLTERNTFEFIEGSRAIRQRLKVTIATIRGEDPFDEDHGLDVFESTGSGTERLRMEIGRALNEDPAVKQIKKVSVEKVDGRKYDVEAQVILTDDSVETISTGIA